MGRLAEALDSMQKAVEKTPWSRVLHYQYAAMLNQSGRYDDAANAATRAILLKRDFPEATHQLASARAGQGSIEQAAKLFAESLVLDPRMGDAWLDWGRMLERRKKTNEAVVVYRMRCDRFLTQQEYIIAWECLRNRQVYQMMH